MRILIAGGGTGGHLFPGVALAEAFREQAPGCEVVFCGARRGLEARLVPSLGYRLITLPVSGVAGLGPVGRAAGVLSLLLGVVRVWRELGRLRPGLVVGLGGYASVPGVLAGRLRGVPVVLLEQNVVAGAANRALSRIARAVYLGFPSLGSPFPRGKALVTGNPLRATALPAAPSPAEREGGADLPRTLLVLGGSQGARRLNDLAMEAIPRLMAARPGLSVIHQTGRKDEERVRAFYSSRGLGVEVVPFIEQMGEAYGRCDLCLARAGALSVSELAAAGIPALYVPYPHAGGHQRHNARWAEERGAAVTLEEDRARPDHLAGQLSLLLSSPGLLGRMAKAAREAGTRDAAPRIARRELALMEKRPRW